MYSWKEEEDKKVFIPKSVTKSFNHGSLVSLGKNCNHWEKEGIIHNEWRDKMDGEREWIVWEKEREGE